MCNVGREENVLAPVVLIRIQHACFLTLAVTAGTVTNLTTEIGTVLDSHPAYLYFYQLAQNQLNSHDLYTRQGLFQFNLIEGYIIFI